MEVLRLSERISPPWALMSSSHLHSNFSLGRLCLLLTLPTRVFISLKKRSCWRQIMRYAGILWRRFSLSVFAIPILMPLHSAACSEPLPMVSVIPPTLRYVRLRLRHVSASAISTESSLMSWDCLQKSIFVCNVTTRHSAT